MRFLIVGSGAREHAAALSLTESPLCRELSCFAASVNPGIASLCTSYQTGDITSPEAVLAWTEKHPPDLVFIGPEAPLETGVPDALRASGYPVVGPNRLSAQIETSKVFARELLNQLAPQASPGHRIVHTIEEADRALQQFGEHFVIKEEGLRGGKGVKVAGEHLHSREEALSWCSEILKSSGRCVIEQKLEGEEFSLLSFCDGSTCLHMPPVQDHKRAFEGDTGPNTGGMGSYTGAFGTLPFLPSRYLAEAQKLQELVFHGLQEHTKEAYQGILYGGYMATAHGIRIIEYNARFGDPEALNLLPLLNTDLAEVFLAVTEGTLSQIELSCKNKASVCKYIVPEGYPQRSVKGIPLYIPRFEDSVHLFLGSVDQQEGTLVTAGSRTLAVTALADTLGQAEETAELAASRIDGPFCHRKDIGTDELIQRRKAHLDRLTGSPLRIGVLGSTKGTSSQPLLDAVSDGKINASIECIISSNKHAYILERGRKHRIPVYTVASRKAGRKRSPEETDRKISSILQAHNVDIVLCIGYMRILSEEFCRQWEGRVFNIHPSLLPDFAKGMDMDVHSAVLESGRKETGCTVHLVTPEVDEGPVILQKRCPVLPADTAVSIKQRVQVLEGEALKELVRYYKLQQKHDKE